MESVSNLKKALHNFKLFYIFTPFSKGEINFCNLVVILDLPILMTAMHDHTLPSGVFPFYMTNSAAEKNGLKNGPGISDLVPLKSFDVAAVLEEITKYGFMSAFEPCQKQLKECNLKEFFIACDPSSTYGEAFLLLYTTDAIERVKQSGVEFTSTFDEEASILKCEDEARREEQMAQVAATTAAAGAERQERLNAFYEENPFFVPREYPLISQTIDETVQEVERMTVRPRRPLITVKINIPKATASCRLGSLQDLPTESFSFPPSSSSGATMVKLQQDRCTTSVPLCLSAATQTMKHRMVSKICQYETLQLDPNLTKSDVIQTKINLLLKRTLPAVEKALQQNESFANLYTDVGGICNMQEEYHNNSGQADNKLKDARCFTDLTFNDGKSISCIDWYPKRDDIFAVSFSSPPRSKPAPAYIVLWKLKLTHWTRPFTFLFSPNECCSFRFNPTIPNMVVAGCTNGQIVMWDLKERMMQLECQHSEGGLSENDDSNCDLSPLQPYALSLLEANQKQGVTDIFWLPPSMQIDSKGQPLSQENLSGQSFQFITVSGCEISFWDTRFRDIPAGKLPRTMKPRKAAASTKHEKNDVSKILHMDWVPIFRSKIRRFEGRSKNISITQLAYLSETPRGYVDSDDSSGSNSKPDYHHSTSIYCTTEEGDIALINWNPNAINKEEQKITNTNDASSMNKQQQQNYQNDAVIPDAIVQWSIHDHFGKIISLEQSPFFPRVLLSVSCWGFYILNVQNPSQRKPLFISPLHSSIYTVGRWSPSRPGLILLAKMDGSVDVWDFMDSCSAPIATQTVATSQITSMEFLHEQRKQEQSSSLLAFGDHAGSILVFEIPTNLWKPHPNERKEMAKFFQSSV